MKSRLAIMKSELAIMKSRLAIMKTKAVMGGILSDICFIMPALQLCPVDIMMGPRVIHGILRTNRLCVFLLNAVSFLI